MKKTIRFLALVLVIATAIGCVSVFARGTMYPCGHSYAESYVQNYNAIGRTYNSQGSETQTAYVYGTYNKGSTTTYNFYGNRASGLGAATSTYSGSSTTSYITLYNQWTCTCPRCGYFYGEV